MRSDPDTPIWDAVCAVAEWLSEFRKEWKGVLPVHISVVSQTKPRRKAKRDRIIEEIRKQTLAGNPPSFSVIVNRHKLPKATASRWRQAGMKKARH